jgi:spore coat polysaccharide biosynthesis predicted glycosyltransferase SpsG
MEEKNTTLLWGTQYQILENSFIRRREKANKLK